MALDDRGNDRVDFVWGNMPLQRNDSNEDEVDFRCWWELYPGDGEAEYYLKGHATVEEFASTFGTAYTRRVGYQQGKAPSQYLGGGGSHPIALSKWNNFPYNDENTGANLTTDWWDEGDDVPAFEFPNIIGLDVEEAIEALVNCGVDRNILTTIEFDVSGIEDPEVAEQARLTGYVDGFGYLDELPAPNADTGGVIIWRYYAPNAVIGTRWDGSPAYARDYENKVLYDGSNAGSTVPVANSGSTDQFTWWHSFVAIQTTDPNKNSYRWWD